MLAFLNNRHGPNPPPSCFLVQLHQKPMQPVVGIQMQVFVWHQLTASKRRPRKLHSTKGALQLKTQRTSLCCVAAPKAQTSKNAWEIPCTSEWPSSSSRLPICCWYKIQTPRETVPVRERLHVWRLHIAHRGPRTSPDECSRLSLFQYSADN